MPAPRHSWTEGRVDLTRAHFELRVAGTNVVVARLGAPSSELPYVFVAEIAADVPASAVAAVRRDLDYYLVEKAEPDPWRYARYHAGTAANLYASVQWIYVG